MSTLQVANIHLESTANNRIQYTGSNTYALVAGGQNKLILNASSLSVNSAIFLNGSNGIPGQVLTSNGTGNAYWSTISGGGGGGSGSVVEVATGNGVIGGPITSSGTIAVNANTGIVANTLGLFVNAAYINTISANSAAYLGTTAAADIQTTAGLAANVLTLTAANTLYVGVTAAAAVVNSATLAANLSFYQTMAGLAANVTALGYMNTSSNYTISGVHTHSAAVSVTANVSVNGAIFAGASSGTAGQVLTSNGSANVYWSTITSVLEANNASFLNGSNSLFYTNATNITTGTLPYAQLGTNVINTTSNFTISGVHSYTANVSVNGAIIVGDSPGTAGQVLTSNGNANAYWSTPTTGTVTSVSPLTIATSGTDLTSTVTSSTSTPVITLNVPNASASNRGALISADWTTFNNKQANLVSGTNIKTIIGTSLLGSGDIASVVNTAMQYTWSNTLTFSAVTIHTANVSVNGAIIAGAGPGTAGQVLTSNGSANVYWSTLPGTNVAAQYAWTNTQSFSAVVTHTANVAISGAVIAAASPGTAGQVLTSNGLSNVYWSTLPGPNTAAPYTWTNVHSHTANVSVNGAIIVGATSGTAGQVLTSNGNANVYWSTYTDLQPMTVALANETDSITTGTAKLTIRAPYAMSLTAIPRALLSTSSSSGSVVVDIKVAGTSILSTNKLTIDASSKTSVGSATSISLVTTPLSIADDAEITFDITSAGTGAKGLKVTLYTKRTP